MRPLPSSIWRTLSLQASFNQTNLQHSGWLFCLTPWLRRRPVEELRAWMARPRAVFNTNPYLAPVLLGARCRIEEDHSVDLADRVEATLQRTLGSIGDALGWRAVRPVWFLGTALAGFTFGPAAVLIAWLLFVVGVVLAHGAGLNWGWKHGLGVVESLDGLRLHAWAQAGRQVGGILAGMVAVGLLALALSADPGGLAKVATVVALVVGGVVERLRRGSEWVLLLLMVGLILFARWGTGFPEAVVTW